MAFSTIGGASTGGSAETPSGGAGASGHEGVDDQSSSNDDQITIKDTEVVINEDSDDVDFRVESNSSANMLFVDAGTDRVGVGTGTPTEFFEVEGSTPFLSIRNTAETEAGIILSDSAAPIAQFARILLDSGSAESGLTAGFSFMTAGGNLTGDINAPASGTTITGSGTAFLTELVVGDRLILRADGTSDALAEIRTITAIASNTSLTVASAFSDLGNDTTPAFECRAMQIKSNGAIGMGINPTVGAEKVVLNGSMALKEQSAAPSATADYCKIVALEDGIDATTVLMLHGDGSDGGTTITDSSTATTKTCTAVNQTHTDTTVKLYGTAAIQFDGTADYITVPDHADFNMAAGDFTYEFWVRFDAIPDDCGFFGQTQSTGTGGDTYEKGMYCYHEGGDGRIYFRWRSDTTSARRIDVSYLANLQANSWYHMAWVRNGPIITPYLNGRAQDHAEHAHSPTQDDIQVGADTLVDCDGVLEIGKGNAFSMVAGYMEEFRITKGVAKYTSDFTPPGSAFPITRLYAVNSAGGKTMIG